MTLQKRTWQILEATKTDDTFAKVVNYFILILIFFNVLAVVLGTVKSLQIKYGRCFDLFEFFSVVVFTIEYIGRIWSCVVDKRFSDPARGRIRFALRFMTVLDLVAIMPFFLPFVTTDIRAIRIFRLFRVVRIAKVGRYYSSLKLFSAVIKEKKEELILTTALMVMLLILSSCLMYYCENSVQPDVFSSIPESMWWAVTTLTTVGYGDMRPITPLGKLFSGFISILGIGMFALPTGILGAGFVEEIQKRKKAKERCPHCGEFIERK